VGLESKSRSSESRFAAFVEAITSVLGHADRASPFRPYCTGLLLPGDRKSVEPMAARAQPGRVQAAHQSLHHFVAHADWSDVGCSRGGARPCPAHHRPAQPDPGLDHRRDRYAEKERALGRRGPAVLRPTRQTGQLPGGSEPVGRQWSCQLGVSARSRAVNETPEPTDRLSPVSVA
jgi:hypothetical protein